MSTLILEALKPGPASRRSAKPSLTQRYEVCRACGREQPPGTEWSDFKAEFRRAIGRPDKAAGVPLPKGGLVESAFGFSVGDRVALTDQRVTFGTRQLGGNLEGDVTAVDPAARDSILTIRVRWDLGEEMWVNHAEVRTVARPLTTRSTEDSGPIATIGSPSDHPAIQADHLYSEAWVPG